MPCMALDPVCVSTDGTDTAHLKTGESGGSVADFVGPLLASEEVVPKHHDIAVRTAVVSSPIQGPAVTGRGADSASSARAVISVGLPAERENLM